jgi:hypothetical protein
MPTGNNIVSVQECQPWTRVLTFTLAVNMADTMCSWGAKLPQNKHFCWRQISRSFLLVYFLFFSQNYLHFLVSYLKRAVAYLRRLVIGFLLLRPGFDPRSVHVGFFVDRMTLGHIFGFPCHISFHQLLNSHLSFRVSIIGQLMADVPSELSLTTPNEIKKSYLTTLSVLRLYSSQKYSLTYCDM